MDQHHVNTKEDHHSDVIISVECSKFSMQKLYKASRNVHYKIKASVQLVTHANKLNPPTDKEELLLT